MCLDSKESLLFVSDSGNNKILAIDYKSNEIKYTIGSGRSGLSNGSFENSEFDWPQGLALDIDLKKLYIADTFNDLIRCADLNSKSLSTLCGIPLKSSTQIGNYDLVGGKKGKLQAISTPWDLCIINKENSKVLLICCAGKTF
jgi:DNA-binding beta-propeller fold protein YncE